MIDILKMLSVFFLMLLALFFSQYSHASDLRSCNYWMRYLEEMSLLEKALIRLRLSPKTNAYVIQEVKKRIEDIQSLVKEGKYEPEDLDE